jgi:inner membrane protein YidH
MSEPLSEQSQGPKGGPRDYLANERTFLAWIRTGASLVSIGIAVAKFGASVGVWGFGAGLGALGCLTLIVGMVQFYRTRRQLATGEFASSVTGYMIVAVGILVLAGAFMINVLVAS